jgi:hypothetical protein
MARKLLDDLEESGIVSSTDEIGPRKALVKTSDESMSALKTYL